MGVDLMTWDTRTSSTKDCRVQFEDRDSGRSSLQTRVRFKEGQLGKALARVLTQVRLHCMYLDTKFRSEAFKFASAARPDRANPLLHVHAFNVHLTRVGNNGGLEHLNDISLNR